MKQLQLTTAARRLAAVLAIATAFATSGAWAANVVWNGNAANGSLSDGGNWDGGVAPAAGDTLDFSSVTSATTLNADFADDRVFSTVFVGTGKLTLNGSLHVSTLTNACKLAVASGATLTIDGELVLTQDAGTTASLLHSNEGTVMVGGKTRCYARAATTTKYIFYLYDTATANTQPIRTKGLAYDCGSKAQLYLKLSSQNGENKVGKWIVGSDGLSFASARQVSYSRFYTESDAPVVVGSSDDWTLANSGKAGSEGGDLFAQSGASITLDTSNCDDSSIGHTITLEGRALINANAANPGLIVKGCGKVVVNTTGSSSSLTEEQQNTSINTALAVTDTATLQVNKGKKIMGSGSVTLAAGTTLLVPDASAMVTLPSLAPAAGSSIVVTNLTAGTPAIALTGSLTMPSGDGKVTLKIGGTAQLEDGIYTVVSSANALPADTVDYVSLDASEVVPGDCSLYAKGGALLLLVGISEPGYGIWVGGTDNNLSTAANWLNDEEPRAGDTLNFKAAASGSTINADYGNTRTFATAVFGSGVVTLTGSLYVNELTNAYTLAVASGAKLDIAGDLVGYAANNTKPLLYSNEGTVDVGGTVRFRDNCLENRKVTTVCQYAVVTENTTPIIAKGIAYHADKQSTGAWYPDYLVANLGSQNNGAGKWVVGSDGFSYPVSRDIDYSGFRILGQQNVTLYSSANWTLYESYRHYGNDLYLRDTATVTIDTTDYNDHTTPRTVTLKGYINAQGSAATPLTITGCGTVVLDSETANNRTNVVTGAIAVTDGATLQINKDVVVGGNGTISLAAGTTLALESTGREFATPDIVPVTLPAEGAATINIDGTRLSSGEHVLCTLASVPETLADHVTVTGTALDGREYTVKAVEVTEGETTVTKLVLDIQPAGLTLIFR